MSTPHQLISLFFVMSLIGIITAFIVYKKEKKRNTKFTPLLCFLIRDVNVICDNNFLEVLVNEISKCRHLKLSKISQFSVLPKSSLALHELFLKIPQFEILCITFLTNSLELLSPYIGLFSETINTKDVFIMTAYQWLQFHLENKNLEPSQIKLYFFESSLFNNRLKKEKLLKRWSETKKPKLKTLFFPKWSRKIKWMKNFLV